MPPCATPSARALSALSIPGDRGPGCFAIARCPGGAELPADDSWTQVPRRAAGDGGWDKEAFLGHLDSFPVPPSPHQGRTCFPVSLDLQTKVLCDLILGWEGKRFSRLALGLVTAIGPCNSCEGRGARQAVGSSAARWHGNRQGSVGGLPVSGMLSSVVSLKMFSVISATPEARRL